MMISLAFSGYPLRIHEKEENMSENLYCDKCTIKKTHPYQNFNGGDTCEICSNSGMIKDWKKYANNYKTAMKYYKEYRESLKSTRSIYDCMVMLSGGKDSLYILDKTIHEHKKNVLAYTYNLPTENKNAVKNIEKVFEKMDVDHIHFTAHSKYKKLIGRFYKGFHAGEIGRYQRFGDDIPYMTCLMCTSYMTISAYIMAYRLSIPYVLYCADPIQIVNVNPDIKNYVGMLTDAIGRDALDELFDNQIDMLMDEDSGNLPKIIYPFFGVTDYDAEEIVQALIEKGIYDLDPSQLSTICSLYGLNNYFSYKNFNCSMYAKLDARFVREGVISREEMIEVDEAFKDVMVNIIPKSDISEEDDSKIKALADKLTVIAVKENIVKKEKNKGERAVDVNTEKFKVNAAQIYNILKDTKNVAQDFELVID